MRGADGTLVALRPGMRIPVGADIVTGESSTVELQASGVPPVIIGEERDVALGADVFQPDVDPLVNAVAEELTPEQAQVLAALQEGVDPFEELDPTAAVLQGGSSGEGGSFTRIAAVIETVVPLALQYPRPGMDYPEGVPPSAVAGSVVAGDGPATPTDTAPGGDAGGPESVLPGGGDHDSSPGDPAVPVDPTEPGQPGVPGNPVPPVPPVRPVPEFFNSPPIAEDDSAITEENTALTGNVIAGDLTGAGADRDPDGDRLSIIRVTNEDGDTVTAGIPILGSNGGHIVINRDGSYSFDPGTDFDDLNEGDVRITEVIYTVTDGAGGTDTAKLVITVTGTNDAPVAQADTNAVTEAGVLAGGNEAFGGELVVTGDVLSNDSDVDSAFSVTGMLAGTDVAVSMMSPGDPVTGTYGTLVMDANGSYTYTLSDSQANVQALKAGVKAYDTFTYQITDEQGATSTATLTITVTGTNDVPVIAEAGTPAQGAVVEQGDGNPAAEPKVSGALTARDHDGDARLIWDLRLSADGAPADIDAPVHTLNGTYGTITITADGQWTYTLTNEREATQALKAGEEAEEIFVARVTDEHGAWDERRIIVRITGANDVPTVTNDSRELTEDQDVDASTGFLAVTGGITISDHDAGEAAFNPGSLTLSSATGPTDWTPPAGGLGTLTLDPAGNYTFSVLNESVQFLGAHESIVQTYTVESVDGTATSTITITIRGTNDAPELSSEAGEDIEEADGLHAVKTTGEVTFSDIDINDVVTLSTSFVEGSFKWNLREGAPALDISSLPPGLLEALTKSATFHTDIDSANPDNATNEQGTTWHYDAGPVNLDFLGAGESLTFEYRIVATDTSGAQAKTDVTITINGTNDAPEIKSITGDTALSEDQQTALSLRGSIEFADLDSNDEVTLSSQYKDGSFEWSGTGGHSQVDLTELQAQLTSNTNFQLDGAATHTANPDDKVGAHASWTYNAGSASLDFLAHGETLTFSYIVTANDGQGGTATKTVTITVTGTNDMPTITATDGDEIKEEGERGSTQSLTTTGALTFGDIDSTDDVTLTAEYVDNSLIWNGRGGEPVRTVDQLPADLLGKLTQTATFTTAVTGGNPDDSTNKATTTWTYSATGVNLDFLGAGESLTFKYQITAHDGRASATDTVTITITGTNDAPQITAINGTTRWSEDNGATALSLNGTVKFEDVDSNDKVRLSVLTGATDFAWKAADGETILSLDAALTAAEASALVSRLTAATNFLLPEGAINPDDQSGGTMTWT